MKHNLESLLSTNWSFVLIRQNKIVFKSKLQGLKPLVFCMKEHGDKMRNATVYDKVVGRAAAILLTSAKVKHIWTPVLSKAGKEYLDGRDVKYLYKNIVPRILNSRGDDICPMEKLSSELPEKEFLKKMLTTCR